MSPDDRRERSQADPRLGCSREKSEPQGAEQLTTELGSKVTESLGLGRHFPPLNHGHLLCKWSPTSQRPGGPA